ncbi:MAG: glycoside hydrolase [Clostridia bacterium]|nr:glycoside hydrolase [Clostridia bacterium]
MKIISAITAFIYYILAMLGWSYGSCDTIHTRHGDLTVESRVDIFCPPDEVWVNGAEYPTVICLENNGEKNGTLLATFEVFDKGQTKFRIMESSDKGDTWAEIAVISEQLNPELQTAWEPCLFELPEAMGNYPKGTIILGEISLDDGCKNKTQLSLFASTDCGKSWEEISVIDEAGGVDEGIWEPWFVYENGTIYCFYSDDSDPVYSQTIVYKSSTDLVNWSEKVPVVVHKNPNDRPGMPVVTKMGNGKYYLTYELLSEGDNKPCRYKISDSISEWNATEEGTEIIALRKRELHTSPICLWIPEGGKNGTLIVNGQYSNKGNHELFVSYDYGKTYSVIVSPFKYRDARGFGYSPAMIYSATDKKIYYINSVDYKDDLTKIQFVRLGF